MRFSIVLTLLAASRIGDPMAKTSSLCAFFRLRPLHPQLEQSLHDAYRRSGTVQRLVDEIEQSDLIVHIVPRSHQAGPAGSLRFVTTIMTTRFLRLAVDETLPPAPRAALLGHELMHAVEVARSPWVTDQASFASLYRQIGSRLDSSGGLTEYDTVAAQRAGAAVLAEISRDERRGTNSR